MDTPWIKATRSGGEGGDCVEIRRHGGTVQIRDSRDPDGTVLTFPAEEWHAFIEAVARGEFGR
jgi:hypothetical protein